MQSLEFKLQPSKQFLLVLTMVFLCSVAIILSLPLIPFYKWALLIVLLGYASWILQVFILLQTKRSIISLKNKSAGHWLICTRETCKEAVLLGDSTLTRWVSILRFRVPAERRIKSCIIFRDALAPDSYRALTVLCKLA